MRVLIFGASGMVGQGVLRECLNDPAVSEVVSVGRTPLSQSHAKLRQVVQPDLLHLQPAMDQLGGFDACFFCLGVSSFRMKEAVYRAVTQDLTLAVAKTLLPSNPAMVFVYVSGAGTDAGSRTMWARVKGETENALLAMSFAAAYMFRPGLIVPLHGIRSKTAVYQAIYTVLTPVLKLLLRSPSMATSTEAVGRAMLRVVPDRPVDRVLDNRAINRIAAV